MAALDGKVSRTAYLGTGYGTHIVLEHDGGLETVYAHLSHISVAIGDEVREGQLIGRSGNSGNSTGAHLHFEVRRLGVPVDPETLFSLGQENLSGNLRVNVSLLFVRSGPGIEYPIIDSLLEGTLVNAVDRSETVWRKIGDNRWIAERYQGKDFCESFETA